MKKSLLALAVLASAGSAMAQSSVTLFGVVDATVQYGRGTASNKTGLGNGGNASSRLGFRGTEDLGGGLAASFWLEAGFNNDDGTGKTNNFGGGTPNNQFGSVSPVSEGLRFARRSTVSLSGGFGEVRLGRDFSTQYLNVTAFDPFGDVGVGATLLDNDRIGLGGPVTVRVSNSVSYILPAAALHGFYGQVQVYRGENVQTTAAAGTTPTVGRDDGNGVGGRFGYTQGPFNIALAYSSTDYLANGNIRTANLGGSYDFGKAKLVAVIGQDKVKDPGNGKGTSYLIGVNVPMGQNEVRASFSSYKREIAGASPEAQKLALGYVHNLSKRTALYTTYAHLTNKNGAGLSLNGSTLTNRNDSSSGLDLGLRHSF